MAERLIFIQRFCKNALINFFKKLDELPLLVSFLKLLNANMPNASKFSASFSFGNNDFKRAIKSFYHAQH